MGFGTFRQKMKRFGGSVTGFGKKLGKFGTQAAGALGQGADITSGYANKLSQVAAGVANTAAAARDVTKAGSVDNALERSKAVYKAGAQTATPINKGPVLGRPTQFAPSVPVGSTLAQTATM